MPLLTLLALAGAPAMLTQMSHGAADARDFRGEDELRRVEQGIDDVGPLGISLRNLSRDLAVPVDFEDVRQDPRRRDQLVRSSGALHAVFPRSWYTQTAVGSVALVPPGTIYRIGSESLDRALQSGAASGPPGRAHPHAWTGGASDRNGAELRQDAAHSAPPLATTGRFLFRQDLPDYPRRNIELEWTAVEDADAAEITAPRIVIDEAYRRQRLTDLRDRVLEAHAARGRSSSSSK